MAGNILEKIVADKRLHVAARKKHKTLVALEHDMRGAEPARGFKTALVKAQGDKRTGLICEIKKASPSAGVIRGDFNPEELAKAYEEAGAACLSVLTDGPYFQGTDDDLKHARASVKIPVLRKDFMIDPYQIAESRALGADCVLLIMACLDDALAKDLAAAAKNYGMDVLLEVHDADELSRALTLGFLDAMIGINNRDLKTLKIDLATTESLVKRIPAGYLRISESGIQNRSDIERLKTCGVNCFLVGENLLKAPELVQATRDLLS